MILMVPTSSVSAQTETSNNEPLILANIHDRDLSSPTNVIFHFAALEGASWNLDSDGRRYKRLSGILSFGLLKRKPLSFQCSFPEEGHSLLEGVRYEDGTISIVSDSPTNGTAFEATRPSVTKTDYLEIQKPDLQNNYIVKSTGTSCSLLNNPPCRYNEFSTKKYSNQTEVEILLKKEKLWKEEYNYQFEKNIFWKFECKTKSRCIIARLNIVGAKFSEAAIARNKELVDDKPLAGMFDLFSLSQEKSKTKLTPIMSFPIMGHDFEGRYFLQSHYLKSSLFSLPEFKDTAPLSIILDKAGVGYKGYVQAFSKRKSTGISMESFDFKTFSETELEKVWSSL